MPDEPGGASRGPAGPPVRERVLQRFINKMMYDGKKSTAERSSTGRWTSIEGAAHRNPLDVFEQALRNATPVLEVKPRRVGGATYQVPVEIRGDRRTSLAMRWLIARARAAAAARWPRSWPPSCSTPRQGQGATIKKKDDTHRMAEANQAFAHYRW